MTCSWRFAACQRRAGRCGGAGAAVSGAACPTKKGAGWKPALRNARWRRVGRWELAGGESVEGAKTASEFAFGQLAFAEERAEKILGAAGTFLGVAVPTAGGEDAVRVFAAEGARHDGVHAR